MNIIGRNIYNLRKQRGMTQQELADAMGIAQPRIAQLESDRAEINPKLDTLRRLAAALNVPLRRLLDEGPAPNPTPFRGVQ